MAQLKEGSTIKKSTGDEVIATLNDISKLAQANIVSMSLEQYSNLETKEPNTLYLISG